jgi:hypothetical protein
MMSHAPRRVSFAAILLGCIALVVGCGPDYKARAVVKGKVTSNRVSLTSGTVTFHGANGMVGTADIKEDGSYTCNDAPLGDVTITVAVSVPTNMGGPVKKNWEKIAGAGSKDPEGNSPGIAIMGSIPSKFVRIDEKYSKPETSGLKYTVEKGENTKNIEL